jgi:peptidoglycan/xylan/chitin deacetylase (PgdA/CDA1 family)
VTPRRLLSFAQPFLGTADDGVLVLAYHLVGAGTRSPIDVAISVFKRQLESLKERFEVISLENALTTTRTPNMRPAVVLTFDDAFDNFRTVAWPILAALELPVTLYVPVGFVEGRSRCPLVGADLPPCSWDALSSLAKDGVDIGSHTVSHTNLRRADPALLERELSESRDVLEQRLGRKVRSFCYPEAKYDRRAVEAARRHYESAVCGGGRRMRAGGDPLRIPRFPVRHDEDFEAMIAARLWLPEAAMSIARQFRS